MKTMHFSRLSMAHKIFIGVSLMAMLMVSASWFTSGKLLSPPDSILQGIIDKFTSWNNKLPADRVYVHTDKPLYKPGEAIWFTAYIRNADNLQASAQSDIVYAELISPRGTVAQTLSLVALDGVATGDFQLTEQATGGLYKIKAYTRWQQNDSAYFEREIQVQNVVLPRLKMKLDFERKAFGAGDQVIAKLALNTNTNQPLSNYNVSFDASLAGGALTSGKAKTDADGVCYIMFDLPKTLATADGLLNVMIDYEKQTESISRSIPIVLNQVDLAFFPEGGDMVAGLNSRVAFRALNQWGKPADVEGVVTDNKGNVVASFSSLRMGMGNFEFTPTDNTVYTAKITKPAGVTQSYTLPEALSNGWTLRCSPNAQRVDVQVQARLKERMYLVAQVRGKIFSSQTIEVEKGSNTFSIETGDFPAGVAQVTLFDSKAVARAERLVFVNYDSRLNITIETDKPKYLPREKVKMKLRVTDDRGIPMPGQFSVAVVNDQLLSFADDRQGNLLSQLLLEQDLNCKVEEPAFYFDKNEPQAQVSLDNLLLTAGWRRFTWQQMLSGKMPNYSLVAEKALVSGLVTDGYTGKMVEDAVVKVNGKNIEVKTDKNGRFSIEKLDLSENLQVTVEADKFTTQTYTLDAYKSDYNFVVYDQSYMEDDWGLGRAMRKNDAVPAMAAGGAMQRGVANEMAVEMAVVDEMFVADEEKEMVDDVATKDAIDVPPADPAPVAPEDLPADADNNMNEMGELAKIADQRDILAADKDIFVDKPTGNVVKYYRARQFPAPIYAPNQQVDVRTDFRSTVYWNGLVQTDNKGRAEFEFCNNDDITSFRVTVEGLSTDGMAGHAEQVFYTQLPLGMSVKLPVEVLWQDKVSLALTLTNNTDQQQTGVLTIDAPAALVAQGNMAKSQTLSAGETKVVYLDYVVADSLGKYPFKASFVGAGCKDAFIQEIKVSPRGFPASYSFAGQDMEKEYVITIGDIVKGSLQASTTAYPSVVTDLMQGVEAILREPYGCFEQTSMSSYPNVMVLDYLKNIESNDAATVARAVALLDKGYNRLTTFETPQKGYEWFGGAPANESLTAYGLLQFNDMKKYCNVDQTMIDRTANWLMTRRDGKGGFMRDPQALDEFGGADQSIINAYVVYSLTEAGISNCDNELNAAYDDAMKNKDPYRLALVASALYNIKDIKRAGAAWQQLADLQANDGSWTGTMHSITRSTGQSLTIETTSLAVIAMIKSGKPDGKRLGNAVKFIVGSRSGYGMFGSTQGTILALKALTEYAKYSKRTDEAGTIEFYVDGKKVAQTKYEAGVNEPILLADLQKHLSEGTHKLKVKYVGVKNPLPYNVSVTWNTPIPQSSTQCSVGLDLQLASQRAKVGETLRMNVTLTNRTTGGLPSTIAIVGIPAGLTAQPWQLKELQDKKIVDYYEVIGNNVVLYYRQMRPSEVKNIALDLKADISGTFEAQASSAYLYYTNEHKTWVNYPAVSIVAN